MPLYKVHLKQGSHAEFQNLALGAKLSEYHRAFARIAGRCCFRVRRELGDFAFDNQLLAQCIYLGARIGEISCPTTYFEEASSISLGRSTVYRPERVGTTMDCVAARAGLYRRAIFDFPPLQLKTEIEPISLVLEEFHESAPSGRLRSLRLGALPFAALVIHDTTLGWKTLNYILPPASTNPELYPFAPEFFLSHGHLSLFSPVLAGPLARASSMDWVILGW